MSLIKERPILFSGEMVRAILAGRKTQTRRVVKKIIQTSLGDCIEDWDGMPSRLELAPLNWEINPYGQPGDRLWVRETWQPFCAGEISDEFPLGTCIKYRADGALIKPEDWTAEQGCWCECRENDGVWKPSIFMPRYASRITLEIESLRVERLNQITNEDCFAEGLPSETAKGNRTWYADLWESINGYGSWDKNPWVWVISFKLINQNGNKK